MASLVLVAMHHCHRNLLGLAVDASLEVDAFAGADATFQFMLHNESAVERRDIEVRMAAPRPTPSRLRRPAASAAKPTSRSP